MNIHVLSGSCLFSAVIVHHHCHGDDRCKELARLHVNNTKRVKISVNNSSITLSRKMCFFLKSEAVGENF